MTATSLADVFRLLQAGNAEAALAAARALQVAAPALARAWLAEGLALRLLGRNQESQEALRAALARDPGDHAIAYENGVAAGLGGDEEAARRMFERACAAKPDFVPARYALGLCAFRARDWPTAVAALEAVIRVQPGHAAAATNLALAFAEQDDAERALALLRETTTRHPDFMPAAHALGWVLARSRRPAEALPWLEKAVASGGEPHWRMDLAKALSDLGQGARAREAYEQAYAAAPRDPDIATAFGRECVRRADFARAAELFEVAADLKPASAEAGMYLAQVQLLRGEWASGWKGYARREARQRFARQHLERTGKPYVTPSLSELAGAHVCLFAEQGLGDELFFLRFVPALKAAGVRVSYRGEARLLPLLARTGLFETLEALDAPTPAQSLAMPVADLPAVIGRQMFPPSLSITPETRSLEAMRRRLERLGPRPWIGVTWRAGTPASVVAHALRKEAPIASLFAALPRDGSVVSLQRDGGFEELERASQALGRPLYDLSLEQADLDDALALVALLDVHVGVSNTNMHLAAAAGRTAHVLVPFPPEWRWGLAEESPWFPGFRTYRQEADGDWSRAMAVLANALGGSTSRG